MFSRGFAIFWGLIIIDRIFYYAVWLGRFISTGPPVKITGEEPPVSVIIAARNEAENLQRNVPHILNQSYRQFEVIVVDDASTDHTAEVLERMKRQYNHLIILHLPYSEDYRGNKKNALTQGIRIARYEHLLFTDADCIPAGKQWIKHMSIPFRHGKELVLGYGAYRREKGLLNALIRYETLMTAWQYFSYALWDLPYMGVGRNLAYTRDFFRRADGFENHRHIRSGDDDLLVGLNAIPEKTGCCFSPEAFTVSQPQKTWREWFNQKRRHLTTSFRYKPIHKMLLGATYISQVLFITGTILILIFRPGIFWLIPAIAVYALMYITGYIASSKLKEGNIWMIFPFLEILLLLFQFLIFATHLVRPKKDW